MATIWGVAPQSPNTKLTIRKFSETGTTIASYTNIVRQATGGSPFILCKNDVVVVSDAGKFFTVKNGVVTDYTHNDTSYYIDNQFTQYIGNNFNFTIAKRDKTYNNIYDIQYWTSSDGLSWTKEFSSKDSAGSPGISISSIYYSVAHSCYYTILGEYASNIQTASYLYKSTDLATWTLASSSGYPRVAVSGAANFFDIGEYVYYIVYGLDGIDYIARRTATGAEEKIYLIVANCTPVSLRLDSYMYFCPPGYIQLSPYGSPTCAEGGTNYDSPYTCDDTYTLFTYGERFVYYTVGGVPGDKVSNTLRVPCILSDGKTATLVGNKSGNSILWKSDETYAFIPKLGTYGWYSIAFDAEEMIITPEIVYNEFWSEEVKALETEYIY